MNKGLLDDRKSKRLYLPEGDLALVLGCQAKLFINGVRFGVPSTLISNDLHILDDIRDDSRFVPLLKRIEDMPDSDITELRELVSKSIPTTDIFTSLVKKLLLRNMRLGVYLAKREVEVMRWMLHKHYDVFGWIEAGLAEDINKQ